MANLSKYTDEQLEAMLAEAEANQPETQRLRTFAQGLTFNFADEIEARARSLVERGRSYEEIRDEIRKKLDDYSESASGEALTLEMLGAAAPTALSFILPGGQAAGAANVGRLASSAARLASARPLTAGAIEGAVSYVGADRDGLDSSDALPMLGAAALGGAAPKVLETGLKGAGAGGRGVIDFVAERFGDKPATAVQAEIRRLARGTGMTDDEIVQAVADGRILAENNTLTATVRALRSGQNDKASALITRQIAGDPSTGTVARKDRTRSIAMKELQDDLAEGIDDPSGNVLRAMKVKDEELGALERAEYREVFGGIPEVSQQIAITMEDIFQRFPDARTEIAKIYQNRGQTPLFGTDNKGNFFMTGRRPTLEDAEILRRVMDEKTTNLYSEGKGTSAETYGISASELREQLDDAYPPLAAVRAQAKRRRDIRDQFDVGRKAMNMSSDELEIAFEQAEDLGEGVLRAFRAGVMDSIRKKSKNSGVLMGRLANEDRKEGEVLRIVYPEGRLDDVRGKLRTAAEAQETYNKVMQNSQTAPEQAAAKLIGIDMSMSDVLGLVRGDPQQLAAFIGRRIAARSPQLSSQDRMGIVQTLFSEDPAMVERALKDTDALAKLIQESEKLASRLVATSVPVAAQQSGGLLAEM